MKVGHALDIRPGNILVLAEDRLDFDSKLFEHVGISYEKTATESALAMLQH